MWSIGPNLTETISPTAGTQEVLDQLSKWEEFTTIPKDEVEVYGLTPQKVVASFHQLAALVSKPLLFNPLSQVIVPYADFTNLNEQRAVLVILFKVQEGRPKRF